MIDNELPSVVRAIRLLELIFILLKRDNQGKCYVITDEQIELLPCSKELKAFIGKE